jgi:hypothetical protein
MKLIVLIGDAAVGKMTVGQELMKQTGLRLFHNHMMIEPVIEIFGAFNGHVTQQLREVIFHEFARSENEGMIFTYLWAFDMQSDWDYVAHVSYIFRQQGAEIYYVELIAPQEVRLQRNETANRLAHKASKRDLEASRARLLRDDANYRCVSLPGEIPFENYLRIDNSEISAETAAKMIREHFAL